MGYPDNFLLVIYCGYSLEYYLSRPIPASVINIFRVVAVLFSAVPPVFLTVHKFQPHLMKTVRDVIRKRSHGCKIFIFGVL